MSKKHYDKNSPLSGIKKNKDLRPIYTAWNNIKRRCYTTTNPNYRRYGGRGIRVCDEWHYLENFYNWAISSGWKKGMTIDRVDNDGDYCPDNCRWITASENSRKKSTTKLSREQADSIRTRINNGEDGYDLAAEYQVSYGTVWFIKEGITHVDDGLCTKKLQERRELKENRKNGVTT